MKKILTILALASLALSIAFIIGCTDQIAEPSRTNEVVGAPEVPRNLATSVGDGTVILSWEISTPSRISRYMIYRGDTTFAAPELIDSTTTLSYTDTGLRNTLRYIYQVTAIGTNGLESELSRAVSATPNIYTALINDNSRFTNSRFVTVSFAAPVGTRLVLLANDAAFTGAQWANFSSTRNWELTSGDGVKSVFARFRDAEGNEVVGTVSDDITLDTRAEIVSIIENSGGATLTAGEEIVFTMNTGETEGEASISIANVATIPLLESGAGVYSATYSIPGGIDAVNATITGNFTDVAGNQAVAITLTSFINIANPPEAAQLSAFVVSEESIELTWTRSNVSDFQGYQVFRSETATVNTSSLLVRSETSAANTTFRDNALEPGKDYYYIVYTIDRTGLRAASNTIKSTTKANETPSAVTLFKSDDDSTSVSIGWTPNTDSDFESYRIYRSVTTPVQTNTAVNLIGVLTGQSAINFTDESIDVGQQFYYVVVVFDKYGARSANSNEVRGPN
ncbi:MAG: hypothetical protein IPH59_02020 [bacterium]|nr:hypothetical protein [bacterium]